MTDKDARPAVETDLGDGPDGAAIIAVVRGMAAAQTADELTSVWGDPFTWFDTGHCSVEGLEVARSRYREQFQFIENIRTDFLSISAYADGDVGFAFSVQHFRADGRGGGSDIDFVFRQTDGLVRRDGEWKVVHQHVSLPIDFSSGQAIWK